MNYIAVFKCLGILIFVFIINVSYAIKIFITSLIELII